MCLVEKSAFEGTINLLTFELELMNATIPSKVPPWKYHSMPFQMYRSSPLTYSNI
jgi:hypothetical protein